MSQTLLKQSDGPTIPGASHDESKDELVFGENSSIDPKLVTATVFSSLFNLTNTIIGAGVRLDLLPGRRSPPLIHFALRDPSLPRHGLFSSVPISNVTPFPIGTE